jgi:predicted esterase YcpF (UPF0227 family)
MMVTMGKKIIVYSHGFGVGKDDRGLFADIAAMLPNYEHILFDYNSKDEFANTLTVPSLDLQKHELLKQIFKVREENSDAEISLICHSQGCAVAAMAEPFGIKHIIFLAPPTDFDNWKSIERFGKRPGAIVDINGITSFPRRDGSTTILKADYWKSRENVDLIAIYALLAQNTKLTIVKSTQDEVLGDTSFSELHDLAKIIELTSDHDFTGENRKSMLDIVVRIIK